MPIDIQKDSVEVALKKLKARENALIRLETISKLGSWEVDLNTKKAHWSDRSYEIYGYEPQSFEPSLDLFFENLLPEYVETAKKILARMTKSGAVESFIAKAKRKDGTIIDIFLNGQVIKDEETSQIKLIDTRYHSIYKYPKRSKRAFRDFGKIVK
jgi:PAS domain-containing protein